nr:hypothetical protein Hi04_10k_c5966_00027 [uncultured bacterium]
MSPELEMLVLCARVLLSTSEVSDLCSAAQPRVRWDLVEQYARNHAFRPVAAHVLTLHTKELIPQGTFDRLRERLVQHAQESLVWLREWMRLLAAFAEAGIEVISFKGPALALTAYHNLSLREFTDLDLLVRPSEVAMAREVLTGHGYTLDSPVAYHTTTGLIRSKNQQISFVKERERGLQVDLHWGLSSDKMSAPPTLDQFFDSSIVETEGQVSFRSLAPEHLLLLLCVHGTKHCWSNLRCLCDLACHIESKPTLNWSECFRLAQSSERDLTLTHSLLLCRDVLGVSLPEAIEEYSAKRKGAILLASQARDFLFRENTDDSRYIDDRTRYREVLRYRLGFQTGWRWMRAVNMLLGRAFVPNEADWAWLRLPPALYFLYYPMRPVRLVSQRLGMRRPRSDSR